MKNLKEEKLLKKFKVDEWKNLSKDGTLKLVAMMPDMDKDLRLKIIDQFPQFTKFAKDVLESSEKTIKQISESNSKDYKETIEFIKETQKILKDMLDDPGTTDDHKELVIGHLMKLVEDVKELEKNNKIFLKYLSLENLKVVSACIIGAIVILGGKVVFDNNSEN